MLEWVERDALYDCARALVKPACSVLDIGCGLRPQSIIPAPNVLVCVEAHAEYVAELRRRFAGTTTLIIHDRVPECLAVLPDRCVDTIFMLDVIEHLEREAGRNTLSECERIARRQVVVFTPLGFMPQDETGETDGWGLHGHFWQTHRSGWTPDDFGERWHVIACQDFHQINGNGERLPEPYGGFWAVLNCANTVRDAGSPAALQEPVNILEAGLQQREQAVLAKEIELRRREAAIERMKQWPVQLARLWRWVSGKQAVERRANRKAPEQTDP